MFITPQGTCYAHQSISTGFPKLVLGSLAQNGPATQPAADPIRGQLGLWLSSQVGGPGGHWAWVGSSWVGPQGASAAVYLAAGQGCPPPPRRAPLQVAPTGCWVMGGGQPASHPNPGGPLAPTVGGACLPACSRHSWCSWGHTSGAPPTHLGEPQHSGCTTAPVASWQHGHHGLAGPHGGAAPSKLGSSCTQGLCWGADHACPQMGLAPGGGTKACRLWRGVGSPQGTWCTPWWAGPVWLCRVVVCAGIVAVATTFVGYNLAPKFGTKGIISLRSCCGGSRCGPLAACGGGPCMLTHDATQGHWAGAKCVSNGDSPCHQCT